MANSKSKIYSFKPPCFERSKAVQPIRGWLRRKTHWLTLGAILLIFVLMLSGCAAPPRYVQEEQAPLPAVLSAPQSPRAKDFSAKVSDFSRRVESYFRKQPEFMTP